jgi:hypothetical protein
MEGQASQETFASQESSYALNRNRNQVFQQSLRTLIDFAVVVKEVKDLVILIRWRTSHRYDLFGSLLCEEAFCIHRTASYTCVY